jgi:hypothetical protein
LRKQVKFLKVASAYLPPGKASGGSQSEALILFACIPQGSIIRQAQDLQGSNRQAIIHGKTGK